MDIKIEDYLFCDPIDPLLNCYQRKDDNTDV